MQEPETHGPEDSSAGIFRGPANWFSLSIASGLQLQQNEAFIELRPEGEFTLPRSQSRRKSSIGASSPDADQTPWSLTIYSAWVDDSEPGTQAASFNPTSLFPHVVYSERGAALEIDGCSRCWSGVSQHRASSWWSSLFRRRRDTYEWRLWVIEYESIMVVASLQSATGVALSHEAVELCGRTLNSLKFADQPAKPPELFRRDVLRLARKHFPLLDSEATGAFGVRIAESEVNLTNFYRSYIQEPNRLREIVLPGLTTVVRLQEWGPDQLMPPLETVADRIMPMLYSDADAESSLDGFVRTPWVGGLSVMYVLDEDETYRFVHTRMMQEWGLTADELQVLAMDNLDHFTRSNPLEVTLLGEDDAPRLLVPVEAHAYNSVRLLGTQLHQKLRQILGPELVVGLPNRDFFVAVSLQHEGLVDQVQERVVQDFQSMHHPLTSRLLVISADGVSEYCEH